MVEPELQLRMRKVDHELFALGISDPTFAQSHWKDNKTDMRLLMPSH